LTRSVTRMTIYDAMHYGPKKRDEIIASYPKHVRRARAMGLPAIGEGAVYPIDDESISCHPFDVPAHWMEIGGLDFGYDHPTAGIRLVFNREAETYYVVQAYRKRQEVPLIHVQNLKGWGSHLPFAWGMEGLQTKLSENPEQTQKMFRKHGLRMVDTHATFANGGVGVERGVMEIYELMMAGRFKIFSNLADVFEEKNTYHRAKKNDDAVAQIVKVHDDLMDAMRYAYMMFRYAVPVSWRAKHGGKPNPKNTASRGIDSRDIFGGR
jgi:hypothetical protein